jgi:hypothetical protein
VDGLPHRHRRRIEIEREADQAQPIAHQHQGTADRQGEIIDPHRKLQIGRAGLVDQQRRVDDVPAVPDEGAAEHDGDEAIEHLDPAQPARRQQAEHQIRPNMTVTPHQLARDDHDRPDDEIDDDLFGVADRMLGIEIAPDHLEQPDHQRDETEKPHQGLLGPVPPIEGDRGLEPAHVQLLAPASAMMSLTISGATLMSFAT